MSRTTLLSTAPFALASALALAAPVVGAAPPAHAEGRAGALAGVAGVRNVPGATALPGKSRAVRMDRKALGQARLRLNLGVGPDLDVVREREVVMDGARRAWIGRVAGDPDSQVVLTSRYTDRHLTNIAGNPLTITAVDLVWPKVQGNLRRVSLGGSAFWSGNLAGPGANPTGGWTSGPARVLETGATEHLRLDFSLSSTKDKHTDYHIVVHFAEGCSVAF